MFKVVKKSIEWGRDTLTLETGKVARQADSTIIATYGETTVLAAVVFSKESKPGQSFFPLPSIIKKSITQQVRYQVVFLKEKQGQPKKKR